MANAGARRAKILMVEDNKDILEEAVEYLLRLGYGVVAASSGSEALAALEANRDLDLLFADVIMPGGLAGRALADRAVQMRPSLKVLLTSGSIEGFGPSKGDSGAGIQFLAKPYRMKELALKIEDVLKTPF
jgi:CheY-like chemotaxis protein